MAPESRPRNIRLSLSFLRIIGPILLILIFFRLDVGEMIEAIRQSSLRLLLTAYLTLLPSLIFRSLRWKVLLSRQRYPLSFWESLNTYAFSILMGSVTPGRIGEFSKAIYLKQRGYSLGISFFTALVDRLFDVFFLLLLGFSAFSFVVKFGIDRNLLILLMFIGTIFTLAVCWFVTCGKGYYISLGLLRALSPLTFRDRVLQAYQEFCGELRKMRAKTVTLAFILTVFAWFSNYYGIYLFALALGFDISFFEMACISAICALVTMVPVSVMGIGTRDSALIVMLTRYGVSQTGAVALSSLILSMLLCNAAICSFSLFVPKAKMKELQADEATHEPIP